jgi:hypothetical protein
MAGRRLASRLKINSSLVPLNYFPSPLTLVQTGITSMPGRANKSACPYCFPGKSFFADLMYRPKSRSFLLFSA